MIPGGGPTGRPRPLRLAFIGAGNVADSYAEALRRMAATGFPVALAAVCARRPETTAAFAARHGVPQAAADARTVLCDPGIDAAVLLLPIQTHAARAARALAVGKHIFCEKTLAGDAATARALAGQARRAGLTLATAPATALSPAFQAARRLLKAGRIGRPAAARAIDGWAGPDWADWFYAPGAGPLRDLGIHALTTLTGLLGPVGTVQATGRVAQPDRPRVADPPAAAEPDTVALTLGFRDGAIAPLLSGFSIQKLRTPGLEIYGSAGTLPLLGQDWNPQALELWTNAAGCWQVTEAAPGWHRTDGLRDFCEAPLEGRPPQADLTHALHVLDITDAAERAARTGRQERIGSGFTPPAMTGTPAAVAPHRIHK
jgi:predicted dehydrogenase